MPRTAVGMYFRQSVIDAVVDLFRSLSSLAVAAKEGAAKYVGTQSWTLREGNAIRCMAFLSNYSTKAQLKETGTVWESCDRLKALPRSKSSGVCDLDIRQSLLSAIADSRELLLRTMTETLNMVNDAFAEFQEVSLIAFFPGIITNMVTSR